jgi:hypothetical protein
MAKTLFRAISTTMLTVLLVLMVGTALPAISSAFATSLSNQFKNFPTPLSNSEITEAIHVALADPKVGHLIDGRPYTYMSYDQVGNFLIPNSPWYPDIHLNVNNTSEVTAEVNLQKGYVISSFEMPLSKITSTNHHSHHALDPAGKAIDYYTYSTTVSGISMTVQAQYYNTAAGNYNADTYFLVNALESGGNDNNACTSGDWTTSYFGQSGFAWGTSTAIVTWADTGNSCYTQFPSLLYFW